MSMQHERQPFARSLEDYAGERVRGELKTTMQQPPSDTQHQSSQWVSEPREVFEYSMIPWVGSHAAAWLRASARPDPVDPTGVVCVPEAIDQVFHAAHVPYQRATQQQLEAMGYPRLPEDIALETTETELEHAARVGDLEALAELAPELEQRRTQDNLAHLAEDDQRRR